MALRSIGDRLRHPKARLAKLLEKATYLAEINRIFRAYLPLHLRPHARIVTLDAEAWTVQTDSPAWATRLRYCLPTLQRQLSDELTFAVPRLRVRIAPTSVEPPPPPPRRLELSRQAGNVLSEAANSLQDPELSNALKRLARHAGRSG
jgi:hypothetical protein